VTICRQIVRARCTHTYIYILFMYYNTFRSAALSTREQRASASAAAATVRLTRENPPAASVCGAMRCAPDRVIDVLGRCAGKSPERGAFITSVGRVDFSRSSRRHTRATTRERVRIINNIILYYNHNNTAAAVLFYCYHHSRNPVLNARPVRHTRACAALAVIPFARMNCLQ